MVGSAKSQEQQKLPQQFLPFVLGGSAGTTSLTSTISSAQVNESTQSPFHHSLSIQQQPQQTQPKEIASKW